MPGAALGVTLLGDNAFGNVADFFNPISDVDWLINDVRIWNEEMLYGALCDDAAMPGVFWDGNGCPRQVIVP